MKCVKCALHEDKMLTHILFHIKCDRYGTTVYKLLAANNKLSGHSYGNSFMHLYEIRHCIYCCKAHVQTLGARTVLSRKMHNPKKSLQCFTKSGYI